MVRSLDMTGTVEPYSLRIDLGISTRDIPSLRRRRVDDTVNVDMDHMYTLRSEFSSKALGETPQRKLPSRERCEVSTPFECCSGTGEYQCWRIATLWSLVLCTLE